MLKLNSLQWSRLLEYEKDHTVTRHSESLMTKVPALRRQPGSDVIRERMYKAHAFAREVGITQGARATMLTQLLCLAPELLEDEQFKSYLVRPGADPNTRFDELKAVLKGKLRGII